MSRAGTKPITLDNEYHVIIDSIAQRNDLTKKSVVLYALACTFPDDFPELGIV